MSKPDIQVNRMEILPCGCELYWLVVDGKETGGMKPCSVECGLLSYIMDQLERHGKPRKYATVASLRDVEYSDIQPIPDDWREREWKPVPPKR